MNEKNDVIAKSDKTLQKGTTSNGSKGDKDKKPVLVPIARPSFGELERAAVLAPLEDGWLVQGPRVKRFEETMAHLLGADHAVAVSSGSAALLIAVAALDLPSGSKVAVPSFTHVATAHAVRHCGLEPLFIDVDPATFNMDPKDLQRRVEEAKGQVSAIIPVHLFGLGAPMDPILELARHHRMQVVEDAACALGAKWQGRALGTLGAMGCFSFHPRKVVTTGEGGMVVTQDPELAAILRSLRNMGAARVMQPGAILPDIERLGYNMRMTDMQGGLGVAQLSRLPDLLAERERLARRYDRLLADQDWLALPAIPTDDAHCWQSYVARIVPPEGPLQERILESGRRRDAVLRSLAQEGVEARPGTHAVHLLTDYTGQPYTPAAWDLPGTMEAFYTSLALPLYPGMTEEGQDLVAASLRQAPDAWAT